MRRSRGPTSCGAAERGDDEEEARYSGARRDAGAGTGAYEGAHAARADRAEAEAETEAQASLARRFLKLEQQPKADLLAFLHLPRHAQQNQQIGEHLWVVGR